MSEHNGTKMFLAFVAGAAIGAAIGYFLNSDKKEELLNDLKQSATKIKENLEENLKKAKEVVDHFKKGEAGQSSENPA
jgi:uncharacterized membrane-anchored protein YhcB (DUF1043 family)